MAGRSLSIRSPVASPESRRWTRSTAPLHVTIASRASRNPSTALEVISQVVKEALPSTRKSSGVGKLKSAALPRRRLDQASSAALRARAKRVIPLREVEGGLVAVDAEQAHKGTDGASLLVRLEVYAEKLKVCPVRVEAADSAA
mgnify:CR=1 FL=1